MKSLLSVILISILATASPAFAAKQPAETFTTSGSIVSVNKSSITISMGNDQKMFTITKHTKVVLDGVTTKWDRLSAGEHAKIVTDSIKSKDVKEIEAHDVTAPATSTSTNPS